MVSSFMGLRRSGSLSKNSNIQNSSSHNTNSSKHNEPKSSHSDSLLSLLSPKSDDGFPSNNNPPGSSFSNANHNSSNSGASLKRNNSTSTNSSSFSDDSVIIRRTSSLNSDKSYANSYDAISPSLQNSHDMSEEYSNNHHGLHAHDIEEEDDDDDDEDPFENELLLQDPPLSPPKELHPGRLYALYEFSGPDPSQCDLEYDDAVILLNDDDSYWWLIKKVKDGKIGFAPAECLETPGERLARLNCWKNEELERIAKEENKKKSKSLLSLSRKASKLASSSSSSNSNINNHSNNSSNHDLLHHHRSLRKKSSSKSVVFSDSLSYSSPAYFTDSEPSDEDYEEDSEPEDDEENIADDVDYSDDNDTLDGISTGDANSTNKIQSIEEEETDKESIGDEPATEEYVSNPGSPDITSPLVVSKIRKKSIENLKNASLFKSDASSKTGVGKRTPTPPALKTNSKDQPASLNFANEPTPEMLNNHERNNDINPNSNNRLAVENGPSGKNLQRNSMLSISDDDASLYNRSSSIYDGESAMFRRSQDLDTMLNSTPMSYQITQTPTAFSSSSNSNTNLNNNNNNNSAITTPPGASSNTNGNNNTAVIGNNNNNSANVNGTNNTSSGNNGNPLAAPSSVFAKRTNSMAGSIKTVSSTYSIGEYSPSSSEFESDSNSNSNSNNQTPTKFTALNALQLSSSTINNGGLKGKISNSSSINQLGSGGLAGAAGIITSNGNTTGLFGTNVHSNNNNKSAISDNDNYNYNDNDAGDGDEYVSDITDNIELDSGYSTDNYNNGSIKEDDTVDNHAQGKNRKLKTNSKKHQKIDINDVGNDVGVDKELSFTKKRSPQKVGGKNDFSGTAVDDSGAKRTLGSPVNLIQNNNDSNITFDNPIAESRKPHHQNETPAATTSNVSLPTNESKDVSFDTNNDIANDTISEIDKQLKEMTTSSISSDNAAETNTADTSFENEKDSQKINGEKQQYEENSKHQPYDGSNASKLTSVSTSNNNDLSKASHTTKPKLLLSPSKSLSKSRNENRLEKVNFDDDEWGLDFENDNDNDNDTLKRTSSPSLASNATSIAGGLSNNSSSNNSNSNSVNASIALGEQSVSMANANASSATQSQAGHSASDNYLNSTTKSNVKFSPKSSTFTGKDSESNINHGNAENHDHDIEHEDVNGNDVDKERTNGNITPDSSFFTNSSSSLVHDDTFNNLTKKDLVSADATSTKTTIAAFEQNNNEREIPASFSSTNSNNNAGSINENHANHNRNNSSTYFNRTNSLSDNSESVESHITPITSTSIDSDIHKKTAIAASGSQINNVHRDNDFVYGVNVTTVSNNNNSNAEYANYINRSENAVNANSTSNDSNHNNAFGSTSGNEEDYEIHPGMESFVSNSSFVSGSGSGTTATIASTATANSANGQHISRNHPSNNGNSNNSTSNAASTGINISTATRGLISTTTSSMTTTTTNNILLDSKHNNNSNAMFGLLENQSFSSLLEGYHPEVNDLFGSVFSKADSIEAQLEDLKKLLIS